MYDWLRLLLFPDVGGGAAGAAGAADGGSEGAAPPSDGGEGAGAEGGESVVPEGDEGQITEGAEGEGEGEGGEGGEGEEGQQLADGRLIPNYIRKMKESDPVSYKAAKDQFFKLRSREAIHPTVQAAQADRDMIESLGGADGIQTMQGDVDSFRELTGYFTKGDPAFAKDMFETDPIAASLQVQPILEQMREKDLEGYKALVSRLWQGEFTGVGLPNALTQLRELVKDNKAAAELVDAITGWQSSISDFASKAEDPRVRSLLAERAKTAEGKDKEAQAAFIKDYETEAVNTVVTDAAKVFDAFFRNRKLDKGDRDDLLRECLSMADRTLKTDKVYHEQLNRHLARGDAKSALKLVKSRYGAALPNAVKTVLKRYGMLSKTPGGQPATQQQTQNGKGAGAKSPAAASGYEKVNTRPRAEDIDRDRSPMGDIAFRHQAVLKNGKKVTWAHTLKH
jgi:hypothetical protein